ncbi:MAG: RsmD family RNA methyltransferase, partial [Mailhella sp.]|nr:RsmD family RNA methyltransferase [Mailhella sp.]
IFWDLGAGSVAVGLEAAGLTDMQVFSVEKNEKRFEQIKKNKQNLGITNYTPILGEITDIVPTLPQADRVFIGGGGKKLASILDNCVTYSKKNAIILVSCVTLETFQVLYKYDKLTRIDLLKIDIGSEQEIAKNYQHFKQKNTLYLFIFKNQNQDRLCH